MRRDGVALVATLSVMAVVALLVFGTFYTTQIERWVTRNDSTSTQANYIAQAGLQRYKTALFQYYRLLEQRGSQDSSGDERTVCFSGLAAGLDLERDGSPRPYQNNSIAYGEETVRDAGGNAVGTYRVTVYKDPARPQFYTIESIGKSGGATSKARAVFQISSTSYLDNAIFAGRGQANRFLNGGTRIRGGIYVVGDPAAPNQTVIESNGNFALLNDYNLNDSSYDQSVMSRVSQDNRTADDLCASLRVRYGQVQVGGSTSIGTPTNKVKGVYVSSGATAVSGVASDVCTRTKGVCTENGPSPFDLSDPPDFPTLGSRGQCSIPGNPNPTWRQCIDSASTTPGSGLRVERGANPVVQWPPFTAVAIPSTPPASCTGAFNQTTLTLANQTVDCSYRLADGRRGGFVYNGSTTPARFEVYGTVNLVGMDVVLSKATDYVARTDAVAGALSTVKNASLAIQAKAGSGGGLRTNGNLLPDASGNSPYPQHVLGLVAEGDVYQNGDYTMAPVYAGGTFRLVRGNRLLGSVVTNHFCTTSAGGQTACNAGQTSEVIYVNTGNNKPAIMQQVGRASVPVFKVLSYERR